MPKFTMGIEIRVPDISEVVMNQLRTLHETMDVWTKTIVHPEIMRLTPIEDARDPRHIRGVIKRNLYLQKTSKPGPFKWRRVAVKAGPEGSRAFIAIQSLHRGRRKTGISRRPMGTKPWTFRLREGEIPRKPWMVRGPPPGIAGDEKDWIITRRIRAGRFKGGMTTKLGVNARWIALTYDRYWPVFQKMAKRALETGIISIDKQHVRARKYMVAKSFSKVRGRVTFRGK